MSVYRLKGTSGPVLNRVWPLDERLVAGGSEDCDLRVTDVDAGGPVAEIRATPEGPVRIRALDPGVGVFLNGRRIEESAVGGGDEIRIGTSRFVLQAPGLRPERVLTEASVRPRRHAWPWLLLIAAALAAMLAWQLGWFLF